MLRQSLRTITDTSGNHYLLDVMCLYNLMHSLNVLDVDIKHFNNILFYLFQLDNASTGKSEPNERLPIYKTESKWR